MSIFRSLYVILPPQRRRQLALSLLLMTIAAIVEMATVGIAAQFLAVVTNARPGSSRLIELLYRLTGSATLLGDPKVLLALLFITAATLTALTRLAITWSSLKLSNTIGLDLSSRIWHDILNQSYESYLKRNSSLILGGLEKVRPAVFSVVQPAIQGASSFLVAIVLASFLLLVDVKSALIIGALTASIYIFSSALTKRRLDDNSLLASSAITARTKLVQEGLGGFRDILLTRSQDMFQRRLEDIEHVQRDAAVSNAVITALPRFFGEAGAIGGIVLVIMLASRHPGGMSDAIPVLGAFALGGQRLLLATQQAFAGWSQVRGNHRLLSDVVALISLYDERVVRPPEIDYCTAGIVFNTIALDGVSFAHVEGRPVLANTSLTICRGERLGLVGASGSGKSTLLDILMGLLQPIRGTLRLNGVSINADSAGAWQSILAHVPQSIYLADDTIAANIAFGVELADIDYNRLRLSADHAGISDVVAELQLGFDTIVGERGIRLSGGQRQRIGIARALYRQPAVLILDEATSALDDGTEAHVLKALANARRDMTIIIVAHRQSSLAICDRIVRIERGVVVH